MTRITESGFILSYDELRILLHSMGVRSVEGVFMPEKIYSDGDIIKALHHMAESGLITAEGDGFTIRRELKEMLRVMVHASGAMIQKGRDGQESFCYISVERIVVSQRYWKKKDTVKLQMFESDEWEDFVRKGSVEEHDNGRD